MFCTCPVPTLESPPNTHVDPVCLGMPGVLPVINRAAVELTIMAGLALHCEIAAEAKFDRKNYHYPDLMKGYQISEYDLPICKNGWLEIEVEGATKRIGITRVHLEEDTARLSHHTDSASGETYSLIDVNRSGLPLMEIVSEPDVRSAEEARAYLQKLRQILRYIGASRANMEEGNMRCEPNVSIRPAGTEPFGQKVELKNINSFKHAYDAIRFEERRQAQVLDTGGRVSQETRGWREDTNQAVIQRSKEGAEDYRYFPEPDLPPLVICREWVDEIRSGMPELPDAKGARFQEQYGLSEYDAHVLAGTRSRADFFEDAVENWKTVISGFCLNDEITGDQAAKTVANWVLGDFSRLLNAMNLDIDDPAMKLTAANLANVLGLRQTGKISANSAKQILEETFRTGRDPKAIVEEQGLGQIEAGDEVAAAADAAIAGNPKAAQDYRAGKEEAIKFLVGQVMKETRGRARPEDVTAILKEKLHKGP
jgi:aspartyl-tRNA(Asn)/glutamyl-tRNA(Gln) amidotransferase subunit B